MGGETHLVRPSIEILYLIRSSFYGIRLSKIEYICRLWHYLLLRFQKSFFKIMVFHPLLFKALNINNVPQYYDSILTFGYN